jgi:hypothetical protein
MIYEIDCLSESEFGSEFSGVTFKGQRANSDTNSDNAAPNIYQFSSGLQPPAGKLLARGGSSHQMTLLVG